MDQQTAIELHRELELLWKEIEIDQSLRESVLTIQCAQMQISRKQRTSTTWEPVLVCSTHDSAIRAKIALIGEIEDSSPLTIRNVICNNLSTIVLSVGSNSYGIIRKTAINNLMDRLTDPSYRADLDSPSKLDDELHARYSSALGSLENYVPAVAQTKTENRLESLSVAGISDRGTVIEVHRRLVAEFTELNMSLQFEASQTLDLGLEKGEECWAISLVLV